MELLNDIIITDIERPIVVHSAKGRFFQMEDRPSYALSLCINGQITYTINGKRYVSDPNHAVLLPQGGTYSLYGDKEGLFPVVNYKCEKGNGKDIVVIPLKDPQACLEEMDTLKRLFFRNESRLKIYSSFYGLLSKISPEDPTGHNPLRSVIQYIEEHLSDPELSNTGLAQIMGISEVYLRKLFTVHQGCTPKQYVLNMRLQKAKQMLVDTPFSVTAVAEACGFSSPYHFCRAFKEKIGLTPTAFAKLNKIYQI